MELKVFQSSSVTSSPKGSVERTGLLLAYV